MIQVVAVADNERARALAAVTTLITNVANPIQSVLAKSGQRCSELQPRFLGTLAGMLD